MKPLYLSDAVRRGLGPSLRPGGVILTRRLLDLLDLDATSVVLDAGCGTGVTLAMVRERGAGRLFGLDIDSGLLTEAHAGAHKVAAADIARLPLPDSCVDVVLCECVWNLTDKERVLAEFARVLRPGGLLALSDIYSRAVSGTPRSSAFPVRCCFSRATDLDTVEKQVTNAGFIVDRIEDHTNLLKKTAAEFVFAHGSLHGFWQAVTGDADLAAAACEASAEAKPGLFLLIAKQSENQENERIRF